LPAAPSQGSIATVKSNGAAALPGASTGGRTCGAKAAPVPYSLERRRTRDVAEQAACLRGWDQIYEQLTPGPFAGSFLEIRFRGIQLFRETTSRSVHEAGLMCTGDHAFGVPVAMQGQGYYCGRPIGGDSVMAMHDGNELDLRAPEGFDIVAVSVPVGMLARHGHDVEHEQIGSALRATPVIDGPHRGVGRLRSFLLEVLDTLTRNPALLQHAAVQTCLQYALVSRMMQVAAWPTGQGRAVPSPTARHAIVARAQEYMREHVEQPLTVEDLCRVLGVSRRTLQYSFQEVLQINPVGYLRAMRLNGARRMLRCADPERATVQDIAARWGFWHLSHFASDYRRMFGERPSETLRHAAPPPAA